MLPWRNTPGRLISTKPDVLRNFYFDYQVTSGLHLVIGFNYVLLALRSIGLKCMDHLFFYKIIAGDSEGLDTYLLDLLEPALAE